MTAITTGYRGYTIGLADWSPGSQFDWEFCHKDYDPTPMYADDGPSDHRYGRAASVEGCKAEIDTLEDDQ